MKELIKAVAKKRTKLERELASLKAQQKDVQGKLKDLDSISGILNDPKPPNPPADKPPNPPDR